MGRYFEDFPNSTWVILSYLLGYSGLDRSNYEVGLFSDMCRICYRRASPKRQHRAATSCDYLMDSLHGLLTWSGTVKDSPAADCLPGSSGRWRYWDVLNDNDHVATDHTRQAVVDHEHVCRTCVRNCVCVRSVFESFCRTRADPQGPVLGGLITEYSTWRWIYLYNAPIASVGVLPLVILWPSSATSNRRPDWKHFDYFGALLLVTASSLIIFVLNQVGADFYRWQDPLIIALTTVSCISWCSFAFWIAFWSFKVPPRINPIFPGDLAARRPQGPTLL
jgi:hypothetical protein